MANPHKFYMQHMNAKTGYRATWDPGRPLQIGQIGKLDRFGVFTVYSSLAKEGINAEVLTDVSASELDYTSSNEVTINFKAAGKAPTVGSALTEAEAGFNIQFNSERGVVFKCSGYKTHQITNIGEIEDQIKAKFRDKNWEKDWLIITQLIEAENATIIISNSANGNLDLKAAAGIGKAEMSLTDASLGLTVAKERGSTLKFISQSHLTPLYRVMGLIHPFLGKLQLAPKSIDEILETESLILQDFVNEEVEATA